MLRSKLIYIFILTLFMGKKSLCTADNAYYEYSEYVEYEDENSDPNVTETSTASTTARTREKAATQIFDNYADLYSATGDILHEISMTLPLFYGDSTQPSSSLSKSPLNFLNQQRRTDFKTRGQIKTREPYSSANVILGQRSICSNSMMLSCTELLATFNSIDEISNEITGGIYTFRNLNILNQDELDLEFQLDDFNISYVNNEIFTNYVGTIIHTVNSAIIMTDYRKADIDTNQHKSKVFIGTFALIVGLVGLTLLSIVIYTFSVNRKISKKEKLESKIYDLEVIEDGKTRHSLMSPPQLSSHTEPTNTQIPASMTRTENPGSGGSILLKQTNSKMKTSDPRMIKSSSAVKSDNYY